ncbi:hypothetical protein FHS15_000285 [Paenibacillus castaneae]|uniref:GNAT family N-acetyltransferase n=1 Tax=Paenibacillus castaneae TaxID=474957 RepID=UPI001FB908CF|nr:GNAT family N-acetyltransferase [Paenibacillus castaneae]NIK75187.1 hypothetical protein [Paenibacillus castaneae]
MGSMIDWLDSSHPLLAQLQQSGQHQMELAYALPLMQDGTENHFRNVRTSFYLLQAGRQLLPMTVNDTEYTNSYVCSPYSTYISYAEEELYLFNMKLVRGVLRAIISSIAPLLKAARINRNIHLNNWLLSTNLYDGREGEQLPQLTSRLVEGFPDHALIFRSLNEVTNGTFMKELLEQGYVMVPSRQVYFFDGRNPLYLKKQNSSWDQKLLLRSSYSRISHADINQNDYKRIEELYKLLYIDKYSALNPQFTEAYIRNAHEHKLLHMMGLRDSDGILQGVVGCFIRGDVITVPLVGYNTSLPQEIGLYRMLMAMVLKEAAEREQLLHLSSGAAHFKRIRGAAPAIEYSAVYVKHLPLGRRWAWTILGAILNKIGVPLMRKYKL